MQSAGKRPRRAFCASCPRVNVHASTSLCPSQPPPHELYEDIYCDQTKDFFMRGCDITASRGVYCTTK